MKAKELVLRCFAEQVDGQWQAFCLDFSLAAQADSFEEAHQKLEAMICEYVYDALAGQDKPYSQQLLSRRAPLRDWARFYFLLFFMRIGAIRQNMHRFFNETVPMIPSRHCHNGA